MRMPWGAIVLDAATREVLAAQGGPSGQPAHFDVLADLAPQVEAGARGSAQD
jgi:hypothetical protein